MRELLAILLLGVLGAPPVLARPAKDDRGAFQPHTLDAAAHFVETGKVRRGILVYRGLLKKNPGDDRARLGLAVAVGSLWDCKEPLEILGDLRGGPLWSGVAARAQARCLAVMGDLDAARAAADDAATLDPGPGASAARAGLALRDGDRPTFEDALYALSVAPGRELQVAELQAEASVAWGTGDVDGRVAEVRRLGRGTALEDDANSLAGLESGRRWLDLDDPLEALASLRAVTRRHRLDPHLGAWTAEAMRRSGLLDEALAVQGRQGIRKAKGALLDGIRARIFVDDGRLDDAASLLAPLEASDDPEVLASEWYLARARGDDAAMARYAARWAGRNTSPDRTLAQLVPIDAR